MYVFTYIPSKHADHACSILLLAGPSLLLPPSSVHSSRQQVEAAGEHVLAEGTGLTQHSQARLVGREGVTAAQTTSTRVHVQRYMHMDVRMVKHSSISSRKRAESLTNLAWQGFQPVSSWYGRTLYRSHNSQLRSPCFTHVDACMCLQASV